MTKIAAELSATELGVLVHAAQGRTIDETAARLRRSPHTVKWLRANRLYPKLGPRNIPHAVAIALRNGLIE